MGCGSPPRRGTLFGNERGKMVSGIRRSRYLWTIIWILTNGLLSSTVDNDVVEMESDMSKVESLFFNLVASAEFSM